MAWGMRDLRQHSADRPPHEGQGHRKASGAPATTPPSPVQERTPFTQATCPNPGTLQRAPTLPLLCHQSTSSAAHCGRWRKTAPCCNTTCLPGARTSSSPARLGLLGAAAHPGATGGPSQQPLSPWGHPLTPFPARRTPFQSLTGLLPPLSPPRCTRPPSGHSPSRAWK